MKYVITGGWAKGYRTYILAAVGVIAAVAQWSVGDASAADAMRAIWEIVMSSSVAAARSAIG